MSAISQYWESHLNDYAPTTTTFVPWQEGAELLGLKRSAFFYLVETGQIRIESGRGPRDGRYSLEDIEAIIHDQVSKTIDALSRDLLEESFEGFHEVDESHSV